MNSVPPLDTANRKRAAYVADTISLWIAQAEGPKNRANDDTPMIFSTTVGQMKFIRKMLKKAARL